MFSGCLLNDSINIKGISASHKSNSSSVPQGYVDSYSTLPWVTWEAVTGVQGYLTMTNRALFYQTKVEGIMLKAAWHWISDGSVVNNLLGEPGCTPLYVGLLSAWGSVDGDQMLSLFLWEGSVVGDSDKCK